ncbi:MAG TPA: hypothetical protein VMP08_00525 [Anaerolineae bacterium]|nr:hypothetical protein [Anaerolineae bacterium]
MKTQRLILQPRRNLKGMLAPIVIALLLVVGMLLASVILPPLDTPVHVLNAPEAAAAQAPSSTGVSGTLASFAALFPDMVNVYLPTIQH